MNTIPITLKTQGNDVDNGYDTDNVNHIENDIHNDYDIDNIIEKEWQ